MLLSYLPLLTEEPEGFFEKGKMVFDKSIAPSHMFDLTLIFLISHIRVNQFKGVTFKGDEKRRISIHLFDFPLKSTESLILAQDERWRRA